MRRALYLVFLLPTLFVMSLGANELPRYSSNGLGGGLWSDPRSWHGGEVPAADSQVVISGADTILFDLTPAPYHCRGIAIDPNGVLGFALTGATNLLRVAGTLEVYGTIRADATREPESRAGLALVSESGRERTITLLRGGAILMYGAQFPAGEQRPNLVLESITAAGAADGVLLADGDAMIDLQRIGLVAMRIEANRLDNTGYKPNERLNLLACHFSEGANVRLAHCDTAVIRDNLFLPAARSRNKTALHLTRGSLTLCRGNLIRGYEQGIYFAHEIDISIQGNQISETVKAALSGEHARNCMIKGNVVSNATTGVSLAESNGVLEELLLDDISRHGITLRRRQMQLTDVTFKNLAAEAVALQSDGAQVTLLNVNLTPTDIKLSGKAPEDGLWVEMMNYLVVRLTGRVPARAILQVATAAVSGGVPKGGAADLNVRNSPATIDAAGWSPLPTTMRPLILRSWGLRGPDQVVEAPFYDLAIYGFLPKGGPDPRPLHKQVVEPGNNWFRPLPNAPAATLEIKLP